MRVLVDALAASTGGGPVRVRELATSLPALRPEDEFVFAVSGEMAPTVHRFAPDATTLTPPARMQRLPGRVLWEHRSLPRIHRRQPVDVALSPFNVIPTRWPERRPVLAVIISNLAPYAPELRTMYGGRPRMRLELLRALTDRTVRRVDRIFLLSTQAFDLIGRDVLGDRAEVIPMAPPSIPDVLPPISDRPDAPFFFFSSDLVRYKGLETAIEALARLDDRYPPFLLVSGRAVESDYAAAMRQLALRLGVERQVRFLGATPHDLVLSLMRESVACVIPSRFENPGRVPVEAMATGAPILASDVPAFREACGDAAWYFPFGHADELAGMMQDLLRRPSLRGPMIEAGLARIAGMVPSSASEQMLSSLDALVAEKLVSRASRAAS